MNTNYENYGDSPLGKISGKPFHKIPLSDINPFVDKELVSTTYVLGSPGSGKSRFVSRLMDVYNGKLAIESGVFELFQKHVIEYGIKKRKENKLNNGLEDWDFDMPNIDGLSVHDNMMIGFYIDDGSGPRNASYSGPGSFHYREFLSHVSSGGKSGFPDWLFIPVGEDKYAQVISFPGHQSIDDFLGGNNKSIPTINSPTSVIYLIDPDIDAYDVFNTTNANLARDTNPPWKELEKHLSDTLRLELDGTSTYWFLSKTNSEKFDLNQEKAEKIYSDGEYAMGASSVMFDKSGKRDYSEIANRLPDIDFSDSFKDSNAIVHQKFDKIIGLE